MSTAELRAAQWRGTWGLAGRETRRVLELWTQTIVPSVVTAALFLAVFGGALGSRIGEVEGQDYLTFILPGLLVMTVASQSFANNSTSIFQAKSEGYIDDVLTSPLRPAQLVAAYMLGGLARGFVAALLVLVFAIPFAEGVERPLLAASALLLTGLIFAALGVIGGIWADTFDQHSFASNLVITPLALFGGVFYSADTLAEPWATLTRFDPFYYLVDATRGGVTGFYDAPLAASLLASAVVVVGTVAVAVALVASGWRLKP